MFAFINVTFRIHHFIHPSECKYFLMFVCLSDCKYLLFHCVSDTLAGDFLSTQFIYWGKVELCHTLYDFRGKESKLFFTDVADGEKYSPCFLDKTAKIWWRENIPLYGMSFEFSGNIWKAINRWLCVHIILYLSLKYSRCTRHCLLSKQLSETIMVNQPKYWDGAKPGLILLLITIKFYQFAKIMIFFRIKHKLSTIQWNFWESNSNICHYKKNWILFSFVCCCYLYVINTFVKRWNLLIFCRTGKSLFSQ